MLFGLQPRFWPSFRLALARRQQTLELPLVNFPVKHLWKPGHVPPAFSHESERHL